MYNEWAIFSGAFAAPRAPIHAVNAPLAPVPHKPVTLACRPAPATEPAYPNYNAPKRH